MIDFYEDGQNPRASQESATMQGIRHLMLWAKMVAQRVKFMSLNSKTRVSIPRTHMVEGDNLLQKVDFHTEVVGRDMYTQIYTLYIPTFIHTIHKHTYAPNKNF